MVKKIDNPVMERPMKKTLIVLCGMAFLFGACNNENRQAVKADKAAEQPAEPADGAQPEAQEAPEQK